MAGGRGWCGRAGWGDNGAGDGQGAMLAANSNVATESHFHATHLTQTRSFGKFLLQCVVSVLCKNVHLFLQQMTQMKECGSEETATNQQWYIRQLCLSFTHLTNGVFDLLAPCSQVP